MYRLHIDIPLGEDEDKAIYKSKLLIQEFLTSHRGSIEHLNEKYDVENLNYRLGHDGEKTKISV
jgi:hypothetical protein